MTSHANGLGWLGICETAPTDYCTKNLTTNCRYTPVQAYTFPYWIVPKKHVIIMESKIDIFFQSGFYFTSYSNYRLFIRFHTSLKLSSRCKIPTFPFKTCGGKGLIFASNCNFGLFILLNPCRWLDIDVVSRNQGFDCSTRPLSWRVSG